MSESTITDMSKTKYNKPSSRNVGSSRCWKLASGAAIFSFGLGVFVQSLLPGLFQPLVNGLFSFIDLEIVEKLARPKTSSDVSQSNENDVPDTQTAQQYMDEYLLKYSHVRLSMHPGCDGPLRKDHQKAASLLDALEITANELGGLGTRYLEFVKRMRGDTVWVEPIGYDWRAACSDLSVDFK